MKKRDGRSISRETLEHLRNQSIRLWKNGKSIKDISDFCGVHFTVVYKWIRIYKQKGFDGLKRRKAKGALPKLSNSEIKKLIKILRKNALEQGFENPLWNCKKINQLIKTEFKKDIHYSNVWRLLKKLGFSYQKPEKESLEKDDKEVKRWLKEEWPKIEEHRRRWQAMLYFQDESSVSLVPAIGKTWAKKGKTPKIKITSKRGSIPISSAISPSGRLLFRIEKKTVSSKSFVDFLKQIMRNHKWRKIIIVTDNYKPHKYGEIEKFLEQNKNRLAIYYLPRYSPDINPQEQVWKYLKNVKLRAHQVKSLKEFRSVVHNNMISIRQKKGLVNSFFYGNILF